jgi:hypothetical protein
VPKRRRLLLEFRWIFAKVLSKSDHTTVVHCFRSQVGAKLVFALLGGGFSVGDHKDRPYKVYESFVVRFRLASTLKLAEKFFPGVTGKGEGHGAQ